jgi:hypothetical protein
LLPVDRLVEPDRAAGILDQLALRGQSEEAIAFSKLAAHWLSFGPPLMIACIPAAALMKLPQEVLLRLELGLLIGTPGLAALTVGVAALTAGLRRGGALAGLLMLPLAVPLLIFGAGLVERGNETGNEPERREGQSFANNQSEYAAARCAERKSYAELRGALPHGGRKHAVQADARQQGSDNRKRSNQHQRETRGCHVRDGVRSASDGAGASGNRHVRRGP